jgi:hypothetical protein
MADDAIISISDRCIQGLSETPPNCFQHVHLVYPGFMHTFVSMVSQMLFPTPSATTLRRVRARVVQSTSGVNSDSNAIEISNRYKACMD